MRMVVCLVCMACLGLSAKGCKNHGELGSDMALVKAVDSMVKIENLTIAESNLRLTYHVGNPLREDIWICDDMYDSGPDDSMRNAETRIIGDALWIKLQFWRDEQFTFPWPIYAKYRKLGPSQSCSQALVLKLPVRNESPVTRFFGRSRQILANQLVLEIGYFKGNLPAMLSQGESDAGPSTGDPNIILVSQLWKGLETQQSCRATVGDVSIPCFALEN